MQKLHNIKRTFHPIQSEGDSDLDRGLDPGLDPASDDSVVASDGLLALPLGALFWWHDELRWRCAVTDLWRKRMTEQI